MTDIPTNGASISARLSPERAGSLGLWVWIQGPNILKRRVFLTCYHVVRFGAAGNKDDYDERGYNINGHRNDRALLIDYPARIDAQLTREKFAQTPNDYPDRVATTNVMNLNCPTAGGVGFGQLLFGSGLRLSSEWELLDWAVIAPSHRALTLEETQNKPPQPPPGGFLHEDLDDDAFNYTWSTKDVITQIGKLNPNSPRDAFCVKTGRSTRTTTGFCHTIKDKVVWRDDNGKMEKISQEMKFQAYPGSNSRAVMPGDSGSMVVNLKKEWVGMITGMEPGDSAIMLPAQVIIDDFYAATGGTITLV